LAFHGIHLNLKGKIFTETKRGIEGSVETWKLETHSVFPIIVWDEKSKYFPTSAGFEGGFGESFRKSTWDLTFA
jgi:hypothetical protein